MKKEQNWRQGHWKRQYAQKSLKENVGYRNHVHHRLLNQRLISQHLHNSIPGKVDQIRTSWSTQDPDPVHWKTIPKPPPVPEDFVRIAQETRPAWQPRAASLTSSSSEEQAPITSVRVPPQPPRARSAEQKDNIKKEVVEEKDEGDMRPQQTC